MRKLTVTTPAWKDGGDIPYENTQYRGNTFPGLAWSAGPQRHQILCRDHAGHRRDRAWAPILHWTLYDIPANVTKLDAGMTATGNPPGSSYGPNIRAAAQPYMGPRTPPGPKHPYHLQVFALDTTIPADAAITYDETDRRHEGPYPGIGRSCGHGFGRSDGAASGAASRTEAPTTRRLSAQRLHSGIPDCGLCLF